MAIQVSGTQVIGNSRELTNIASVDATTAASITAAGVGGSSFLNEWTPTILPQDSAWAVFAETSGAIIFLGGTATSVAVSTNGVTYTQPSTFSGIPAYKDSAYNPSNNLLVVVGNNGYYFGEHNMVYTSDNGSSWGRLAVTNSGNSRFASIDYSGSLWVAGGQSGRYGTSTNGTSWTDRGTQGSTDLGCIRYLNGLWFMSNGDTLYTSSSGTGSWTARMSSIITLKAIAYYNNMYVAAGSGGYYTSTNGTSWSALKTLPGDAGFEDVVYNSSVGLWLGAYRTNSSAYFGPAILTTTDPTDVYSWKWNQYYNGEAATQYATRLAFTDYGSYPSRMINVSRGPRFTPL